MKWIKGIALCAFMLFASKSWSQDQEVILWKTVNNWGVYIDRTLGDNCYTFTTYRDGTVFRFGFQEEKSKAALYVAIGNSKWASIENGKDYALELQLDNEPTWPSPATGMKVRDVPFLVIGTNQTGFVDQLMRKHTLKVYFNNSMIQSLSLRGSYAALQELGACQSNVDAIKRRRPAEPPADPFSGVSDPQVNNADPFDI